MGGLLADWPVVAEKPPLSAVGVEPRGWAARGVSVGPTGANREELRGQAEVTRQVVVWLSGQPALPGGAGQAVVARQAWVGQSGTSRMTGDCHVRICGGQGVRLPLPTRPAQCAVALHDLQDEWDLGTRGLPSDSSVTVSIQVRT